MFKLIASTLIASALVVNVAQAGSKETEAYAAFGIIASAKAYCSTPEVGIRPSAKKATDAMYETIANSEDIAILLPFAGGVAQFNEEFKADPAGTCSKAVQKYPKVLYVVR